MLIFSCIYKQVRDILWHDIIARYGTAKTLKDMAVFKVQDFHSKITNLYLKTITVSIVT